MNGMENKERVTSNPSDAQHRQHKQHKQHDMRQSAPRNTGNQNYYKQRGPQPTPKSTHTYPSNTSVRTRRAHARTQQQHQNKQTDRQTDRHTDRRTDGRTDRQTGRQAGSQTGRQAGSQTDGRTIPTHRQAYRQQDPPG